MKTALVATALMMIAFGAIPARSQTVTYLDAGTVSDALAKGGSLVTAPDLKVSGNHRAGPGEAELHDKETDIFYVVEGNASFVTGGTILGGRQTAPGQTRGTDIRGGLIHRLKQGDVIVVPAGIPHWFKEVSPTIKYLAVKVLKP